MTTSTRMNEHQYHNNGQEQQPSTELHEHERHEIQRPAKSSDKILKLVAQHRASDVAIAFLSEKLCALPKALRFSNESRVMKRQIIDFRQLSLQSELNLTEAVEKTTEDELIVTLFDMFDSDGGGSLSVFEIALCLTKMDTCGLWGEALKAAELSVTAFDDDQNGGLDFYEFVTFLETISINMECSMDELCRYLILRTVENESGENVLDEVLKFEKNKTHKVIVNHMQNLGPQVCQCVHARLVLIFQLLDYKKTGQVTLVEVERSLSPILHHMDKSFREGLFDDRVEHTLCFDYFVHLLFAVVAASSVDIDIDEVCNTMTTDLCDPDHANRNRKLQSATWTIADAIQELQRGSYGDDDEAKLPIISEKDMKESKMNQLFDSWDDDNDGSIDLKEFFSGWRKLQIHHGNRDDDQNAEETLRECIKAFAKFENKEKGDHTLSKLEIAQLLCLFSDRNGTDLKSTVEYLLIQFTLNTNSEDDQKFIDEKIMKAKDKKEQQNKEIDSSGHGRWPWGRRNSNHGLDDSSSSNQNNNILPWGRRNSGHIVESSDQSNGSDTEQESNKKRISGFLGFRRLSFSPDEGCVSQDEEELDNKTIKTNNQIPADNRSTISTSSDEEDTVGGAEEEPQVIERDEQEVMYDSVDSLCPYSLKSLHVNEVV